VREGRAAVRTTAGTESIMSRELAVRCCGAGRRGRTRLGFSYHVELKFPVNLLCALGMLMHSHTLGVLVHTQTWSMLGMPEGTLRL
jgi:hypothetical protein